MKSTLKVHNPRVIILLICINDVQRKEMHTLYNSNPEIYVLLFDNAPPLSMLVATSHRLGALNGQGKPVLIMHIGFFACFYAISLERSRFSKIATLLFLPL